VLFFYNGVDSAWQAALGNGEDCIIINDITPPQTSLLLEEYHALLGQNKNLNLQSIKMLLAYTNKN
jgi:hypothetical protein